MTLASGWLTVAITPGTGSMMLAIGATRSVRAETAWGARRPGRTRGEKARNIGLTVKYYTYISDAKVDMLLGGLPEREKQKLAVELKVNLGVFAARVTTEGTVGPMDHRVPRLEAVVRHLTTNEWVGTVESPGTYIADTLVCSHGVYRSPVSDLPPAAMFASESPSHCFLMIGSVHHIIGSHKEYGIATSPSWMVWELLNVIEEQEGQGNPSDRSAAKQLGSVCFAVEHTTRRAGSLQQRFEFFAKRLAHETLRMGDGSSVQVTLATPLYVAMAD